MRIGVVFPQTEIGADVGAVRAYGEGVAALGFDHLLAYDHVLGADRDVHRDWGGPYDVHTTFHEPLVLFGYLAALTSLELVTAVLVLPQRQTALVAKQAAQVDLLSGGRLRLGIGLGWNQVEYDALGQDFSRRGRRCTEQVTILRRLWAEQSITTATGAERLVGAGLAPRPARGSIPIWFGGHSAQAHRRIGELGDGWFPQELPGPGLDAARAAVEAAALAVGRDPAQLGMEGIVVYGGDLGRLERHVQRWRQAGASHLSINTMGQGLSRVDEHLEVLSRAADALGVSVS